MTLHKIEECAFRQWHASARVFWVVKGNRWHAIFSAPEVDVPCPWMPEVDANLELRPGQLACCVWGEEHTAIHEVPACLVDEPLARSNALTVRRISSRLIWGDIPPANQAVRSIGTVEVEPIGRCSRGRGRWPSRGREESRTILQSWRSWTPPAEAQMFVSARPSSTLDNSQANACWRTPSQYLKGSRKCLTV